MPHRINYSFSTLPSTYGSNVDDFLSFDDETLITFQDFDEFDFTAKDNNLYQQNATLTSSCPSKLAISPVQSLSDMSDSSLTTATDDEWLTSLNPGVLSSGVRDASKRTRDNFGGDARNECWTSPLCPSKKEHEGGIRPGSCRGECADFLFALPPDTSFEKDVVPQVDANIEIIPPRSMETRQRSSKRLSDSSRREEPTPPPPPNALSTTSSEKSDKPKRRVPHSQVEKKYRENVNAQLEALRRAVPSSRNDSTSSGTYDIEDLGASSRQPSKAIILSNATAYIKQLEKDMERIQEDLENTKAQNRTLQLVLNGNSASLLNSIERWKLENEP